MPRFFVPKTQLPHIYGEDVHHIRDVLRMRPGDTIELLDGQGKIYTAKINEIYKDKIACEILSAKESAMEPKVRITLAQCLPKYQKMQLIIQKCSELGVCSIIPVISERTIAKGEKQERWQAIAKEAAQQCGLPFIPAVNPLLQFGELINLAKNYALALIPWELETTATLKSVLATYQPSSLLVLIGPEGGFSQNEIHSAQKAGFIPVSLGPRILRTESAAIALLAMINYAFDQ